MRTPDKSHKVPVKLVLGLGGGLVLVMVLVTYRNYQVHQEDLARARAQPATTRALAVTTSHRVPKSQPSATESALVRNERNQKIRAAMAGGWELVNQRDPRAAQDAIDIFQDAITQLDPDNAQFYNGLGRASLIAKKPQDAINAFREGLEIDPSIAEMQSGIGWGYWQLHQPYQAKQAWEAALRMDPNSPDAWTALAWIYLALGENAKAKAGFVILQAGDPKNKDYIEGLSLSRNSVRADLNSVEHFFALPPLESFNPPASAPTSGTRP